MVAESRGTEGALTATGWTVAPQSPQVTGNTRFTVLYRFATSSNPTTTNDTGDHQIGRIIGIKKGTFNPFSPFNASAGGVQAVATKSVSVPGATTTVDKCLVLAFASGSLPDASSTTEFGAATNASLSSITERIDNAATAGDGGAIWAVTGIKATAGTYNATTCTAVTEAVRGVISLAIAPGEWELSLDSGLEEGDFAHTFLGVLNGELYLFGSSNESAGDMAGVHRWTGSSWTQIYAGGGEDFNGLATYGAVPYADKLYVGDRRQGRLYRLDLKGNGEFQALTHAATVGAEDVFPGPVLWGRLYLGTFGNAFNEAAEHRPPEVCRYNGTAVTQVLNLSTIGIGGEVTSMVYFGGKLWISAANQARTLCEIWTIEENDTTTKILSGSTILRMAVWKGQLVAATSENEEVAPGADSEFRVWDGAEFDPFAGPWTVQVGSEWVLPVAEQLWGSDYYRGVTTYTGSQVMNIGLGAWVDDPAVSSPTSSPYGGAICARRLAGYLYLTTNQPVKVWRLPVAPEPQRKRQFGLLGVGR